ncbi:MAG: autotransporter outer membrane beta-barrel domain-containing protein [Patiriisocius sp.]|uniref:autotransporter outer membrane beta-barrel domain-containing protein n=1 Tax=Patiriisocius sp. TaxID=2822396 RepID=UPI003EF29BE2
MKKIAIVIFTVFSVINMISQENITQIEKGSIFLNGTVGFNSIRTSTEQNEIGNVKMGQDLNINLNPKIGYFVANKFVVGLQLNIDSNKFERFQSGGASETSKFTTLNVGPFLRYYIFDGLFGEGSVGFGSYKNKFEDDREFKSNLFQYNLGIGYAIFIGKSLSVEPLLRYQRAISKPDSAPDGFKNIASSLQFAISLSAYL